MIYNFLAAQADGLDIAYIVVTGVLILVIVAALIAQIFVAVGYWQGNRVQNSLGLTGEEFARRLLDANGMQDVQVKKCGILRTLLFGNHYSIMKRTVYLRTFTIKKASVTSVGDRGAEGRPCGNAPQRRQADDRARQIAGICIFAPSLFLPLLIIGLVVDLLVIHFLVFTIVAIVIGLLFIVFSFVVTLLNIPVEKRAMVRAKEWLNASLTPEENNRIEKIFRCYMVEYVLQFIIAILRLIQLILKILSAAKR